jgi:cytochrome c oxidase cbb3-type subunit III
MNAPQEPQVLEHDADGITELDNQLPRWWVWLFVLCVVWAVVYFFYFEVLRFGPSSAAAYDAEVASFEAFHPRAAFAAATEPSTDPAVVGNGQMLFLKNCVVCHGAQGGGLIGPNLCDSYFLHGPTFADALRTITEGVPAKGMITWKNVLRPQEIQAVASYVYTLRGTSPANPKPPQGDLFQPGAAAGTNAPAAPSTAAATNAPAAPPPAAAAAAQKSV